MNDPEDTEFRPQGKEFILAFKIINHDKRDHNERTMLRELIIKCN